MFTELWLRCFCLCSQVFLQSFYVSTCFMLNHVNEVSKAPWMSQDEKRRVVRYWLRAKLLAALNKPSQRKILISHGRAECLYLLDASGRLTMEQNECAVCLEQLVYAHRLQCGHRLHKKCFEKWTQQCHKTLVPTTCPECRDDSN